MRVVIKSGTHYYVEPVLRLTENSVVVRLGTELRRIPFEWLIDVVHEQEDPKRNIPRDEYVTIHTESGTERRLPNWFERSQQDLWEQNQ